MLPNERRHSRAKLKKIAGGVLWKVQKRWSLFYARPESVEAGTAPGVERALGQFARERRLLLGAEKAAYFDAFAARDQRNALGAKLLMHLLLQPNPGRIETPDLALAADGDLFEHEFKRRHIDVSSAKAERKLILKATSSAQASSP